MDSNQLGRHILFVVLLCVGFNNQALSEHRDPAPIPDEIARTIASRMHGAPNALPQMLRRHLDETEQILENESRDGQLIEASRAMLLRGKLHEIKTMRIEARAELSRMRDRQKKLGLADKARELDALGKAVEQRFDRLITALGKLQDAKDTRGRSEARLLTKQLLREYHGRIQDKETELGPPQPTFQAELAPSIPAPPPSTSPPAYVTDAEQYSPLMLASSSDSLIALAPSPTPTEAQSCSYTNADLGIGAQIPSEIRELAESMGYSPARLFEYVANEIRFEPYYGSLKGAVGTLYGKAGGPTDQASLLIALLRASNIPARYVKGTIQVVDPVPMGAAGRASRWIGAKTYVAAAQILSQGRFPGASALSNGIQFTHVWVEACVPYANYRGARNNNAGHRWIPLDPSFKDNTYQPGIAANVSFDYTGFLAKRSNELVQESYISQVETAIKSLPPLYANNTVEDVGYKGSAIPQKLDILPTSLPYEVVSFTNWDTCYMGPCAPSTGSPEIAQVPLTHSYKLQLVVGNGASGQSVSVETFLPGIALMRLTLSFMGVDTATQTALDNWKNDPNASALPCNLNVIPVIYAENFPILPPWLSIWSVGVCTSNNLLEMVITLPELSSTCESAFVKYQGTETPVQYTGCVNKVAYNNISAANYHALQAYAFQASDRLLTERAARLLQSVASTPAANSNSDEIEGEFLHLVSLKYMRYITDAAKRIGELTGSSGESGNHLGLASGVMKVQYLFDLPFAVYRSGLLMDMPGGQLRPIDLTTANLAWEAFLLSSYSGSHYESYIWQENARMDAVSTVRGIQYARETGIEVLTLNSSNWAAQSPKFTSNTNSTLNYSTAQVNDIYSSYITQGRTVTIPRSLIQYGDWKGAVFVAERSTPTSASASFIINKYSGGYTVGTLSPYYYQPSLPPTDPFWGIDTGWAFTSPPSSTIPTTSYTAPPSVINSGIGTGITSYTTTAGDPVNMVTGNMYHTERDINIKGRGGLPIVFERSYNSREAKDGPLGFGWTHSFNHYLVFKDDKPDGVSDAADTDGLTSSMTWVDGTGSEKFIQVIGTGSGVAINNPFTPPQGFFFQTTRNNDGTYSIREKNGLTYTFENVAGTITPAGQKGAKLLNIKDRNGNTLTMGYNGANLTSVTDGLGRVLTLTPDGSNRITQISDWTGRVWQYTYNANGDLITYKNPLAVSSPATQPPVTYTYYTATDGQNLTHAMKKYALPRGNGMTFEYYMNGRVFRHYNTLLETTTFTYNDFRRETVSVNERGFERHFFFDANGNPLKIVEESGAIREYTYDPANPFNRLTKRAPMGYTTSYQYDTSGNVTKITNPSGNAVEYSYFNGFNQPGKIKDARGNYAVLKYDAQGNLLQEIKLKSGVGSTVDPSTYTPTLSQLVSWNINSYDSYGNVTTAKSVRAFISQDGPTVEKNYNDTVNNVQGLNAVAITRRGDKNGDGTIDAPDIVNLAYDALGRVKIGIDADWHTKQYFYNSSDRVTRAMDAVGNLRDYAYDTNGNPVGESLVLTVNGASTLQDSSATSYDKSDRKYLELDAAGNAMRYDYDAAGNVIQITNPDNYSLAFEYDAGNHVTKAYDRENNAVTRILDLNGKPRTVTDPNGNTVRYSYYGPEREGRLKSQTDALNRVTTYDYDPHGNVITFTDNLGRTTLTQYDELNRPTRVAGPSYTDTTFGLIRPLTTYSYDNLGRLATIMAGRTDATGTNPATDVVTTQMLYVYDDFGRKLKETDALGKFWTYEYDLNGNVTKVTDPKNQLTQYTWGYGHQLLSRMDANGNLTSYIRNALGQPLVAQSPGVRYNYAYDDAHRLKSVTDSRANKTLTYAYSPGGLLNTLTDGEGKRTDYLYDPVGRLTGIWAPNLDYVGYNYDPAGRLTEKWLPNGVNTRYQYNPDNTLVQVTNRVNGTVLSQHDYTYDDVGNRMTHTENINGTTTPYIYLYDELNRLKEVRHNTTNALIEAYANDPLGNRTTKTAGATTYYYSYDVANALKEIRTGSPTGTLVAGLVYDANGNLTKKCESGTVTRSDTACTGSTITTLTYNALNQLAQATKTGLAPETYVYDDQGRRIQKTGSSTTNYLYNGPDITAEYGTGWTTPNALYTHGPSWDDPILRTTSTTTQYYHQDGLGSVVAVTDTTGATVGSARYDAWGVKLASTGTIPTYGYTGREPDATGLIYYRARTYDPSTGTFTQRDPIGFQGGINLYAYVGNNPTNYTDPTGECPWCVTGLIGGSGAALAAKVSGASWTETGLAFVGGFAVGSGLAYVSAPAWVASGITATTRLSAPAASAVGTVVVGSASSAGTDAFVQGGSMLADLARGNNPQDYNFGRTGLAAFAGAAGSGPAAVAAYGRTVATELYGAESLIAQAHQITVGQQIAFTGAKVGIGVGIKETANFVSDSLWGTSAGNASLGTFTSGSPIAPYAGSVTTGFNPRSSK